MAYDLSNTKEFRERIANTPVAYNSLEEEANAIKAMFEIMGKPE